MPSRDCSVSEIQRSSKDAETTMQLHSLDAPRKTTPLNEPAVALEETENKSNNGHKYIPEENEDIRFLQRNLFPNGTCFFKERHPGIFPFSIAKVRSLYHMKKGRCDFNTQTDKIILDEKECGNIDSEDDSDPDIEIVISQDVLSGQLFCNAVFTDELDIFLQSNIKRRVLATSHASVTNGCGVQEVFQTPDTDTPEKAVEHDADSCFRSKRDSQAIILKQTVVVRESSKMNSVTAPEQSARSPGSGDSIPHIPGLLHVPHMAERPARTGSRRNFNRQPPDADHRNGRAHLRRLSLEKQRQCDNRGSTAPRNRDRRPAEKTAKTAPPDLGSPTKSPHEKRTFYSGRYYNTNTYCSEHDVDAHNKPRAHEQGTRWSQESHSTNRKTNTSWSEGDIPHSRHSYSDVRADPRIQKKIIIRKRDSVDNATQPVVKKVDVIDDKHTKQEPDNAITQEQGQKQAYTQSVTMSGSRPSQKPVTTAPEHPASEEVAPEKAKKKKRRSGKKNKKPEKPPKSQVEILQRQIDLGQLKSFFSKYRTEGLKNLKLTEKLHTGTFSTKYKAVYQNETVLVSVFCDQDVSDIAAVDMAHMRGSYFVNCLKDCIRGPVQSLWLMTRFCRLGDLGMLLLRDPHRHVVGELHAQFVVAGMLVGVEYLHRNDIVHGNIKPSKILFNNEGFPVLTGFLKVSGDSDTRDVYTPAYAAPERLRGDRSAAVDIFSIGCVAYEIIMGRTPFDGGSLDDTKAKIVSSIFRPEYDPECVSFAGEMFIDLCLQKKASERFKLRDNRLNLMEQEWFSMLNPSDVRRQIVHSPILDANQLLNNKARLSWEEKIVGYNWGRVMDQVCPNTPSLAD